MSSICSISAYAYTDNNRDVDFFGYSLKAYSDEYLSAGLYIEKYFSNRNWVVSVTKSEAIYQTYHVMVRAGVGLPNSPMYFSGNACSVQGIGNSGGSFSDSSWMNTGGKFDIASKLDIREASSRYVSGQFSPDSAW